MKAFMYTKHPADLPTAELVYPLANAEGHQTIRTAVAAALMRLRPLARIPAAETTEGLIPNRLDIIANWS